MVYNIMLIQVGYEDGQFQVRNQTIYYQGVKVSPMNPAPLWSVGEYELYLFPAIFPLQCGWLVVVQSRVPAFYECKKVKFEGEKVTLYLTNGKQLEIKPFRDGIHDRLLVNSVPVYKI